MCKSQVSLKSLGSSHKQVQVIWPEGQVKSSRVMALSQASQVTMFFQVVSSHIWKIITIGTTTLWRMADNNKNLFAFL